MMSNGRGVPEHDQSEIRLMGLILVQAMTIGLAVGIFDAEFWIVLDTPSMNGITYAMAAFAVQGLAYYFFKMFFQQGMDEKARFANQERERRTRYRGLETEFDAKRMDMEYNLQRRQLDTEIQWMEDNPGRTPPWVQSRVNSSPRGTENFIPNITEEKAPLTLGVDYSDDKLPRGTDGKFKKKE
jgi:hypothetical protein